MATFVLVPGYWLGAWVWEEVARDLRAAGHEVIAVTLTGLAERADEATPEVDLDTHIADVLAALDGRSEVVLVAHSGATMPVTGAADRAPGRLARVVYVDCAPLPSGWAQHDFQDPEQRAAIDKRVADEGDGWRIPVPAFDPAEDPQSLADLSEERLAEMRRRGTPQPFATATQPLVRPDTIPATPKTMIACTFPLEMVRQLVDGGNPAFAMLTGPEWTFHSLPTGHWPMLSRPAALAALLNDLQADG